LASKSEKKRRKRRQAQQRAAAATPETTDGLAADPAPTPAAPSKGPRRAERNADDERPPAPWGKFPLIELTVLAGIIMLILGLLVVKGEAGMTLVIGGLALASIGGLDTAIREHFAGYRSHTLILAGVPAAIVLAALFIAGPDSLPTAARVGIAAVVYVGAAVLLVRVFRSRSGGRSFRFSSLTGR
jgi:hypothetical protein